MGSLEKLSNNDLWGRYREAMDGLCADPESLKASRKVNELEEEILRRMRAVCPTPMVREA